MKKTLVALAVAAVAATSANAAVVYNQDGTKVELGGSLRLVLVKQSDKRTDLQDEGSRIEFKASHDLGEGLSALGYARLGFDKNFGADKNKDSVVLKKLYAGFSLADVGALTFGKQDTNGDDVHLADYTYTLGNVNKMVTGGDKVARFTSAKWNGFYFGLDYVFDNDATKRDASGAKNVNNRAYVLSAFYERQFGDVGFALNAGYSHKRETEAVSHKAFTVASEVSYGPVAFAVDYSQIKSSNGTDAFELEGVKDPATGKTWGYKKSKAVELAAKYQVTEKSKVYVGYKYATFVDSENEKVKARGYLLGADYQIHPQVVTYVEGGSLKFKADGETVKKDNKVALGLRVFF